MDGCFADDNAGTLVDNALGGIEHTHNDIPCVADNEDGKSRLENPAEEHGGVKVVHIVLFGNHLDKLMAHHPRARIAHLQWAAPPFGKTAGILKMPLFHACQGRTNVEAISPALAFVIEQAGEVARDAIDQNAFYPFLD